MSSSLTFLLSLYYVFSVTMNLFNAYIYNPRYLGFAYPLRLTTGTFCLHFLAMAIYLAWVGKLGLAIRALRWRVVPCAFFSAAEVALSNLSLRRVSLSVYVMVKSCSPIFILLASVMLGIERMSKELFTIIALIAGGVQMAIYKPSSVVDWVGLGLVLMATAMTGMRWCTTQVILHSCKDDVLIDGPVMAMFSLSPIMALLTGTLSLILETGPMQHFLQVLSILGLITIVLLLVEYALVQRASAMTLSVASVLKELLVISISVLFLGEPISWFNLIGLFLSILGILLYTRHKQRQEFNLIDEDDPLVIAEESLMVCVPSDELLLVPPTPLSRANSIYHY